MRIPAIHVSAALEQSMDARVKPGYDESYAETEMILRPDYSAGVGLGGGLAGGGVAADVRALVAFFSTMRTAMIEPS
jgi:hypothetical protein